MRKETISPPGESDTSRAMPLASLRPGGPFEQVSAEQARRTAAARRESREHVTVAVPSGGGPCRTALLPWELVEKVRGPPEARRRAGGRTPRDRGFGPGKRGGGGALKVQPPPTPGEGPGRLWDGPSPGRSNSASPGPGIRLERSPSAPAR